MSPQASGQAKGLTRGRTQNSILATRTLRLSDIRKHMIINDLAAGPVSRILSAGLLRQDGHSSGPNITARLKRPTRRLWRAEPARAREAYSAGPRLPPYLVLLRVGFALPAALLRRRCALTAPFHPYLSVAAGAVCFLWHFPSNGPAQASLGEAPSRTLSGTPLSGVRTFLPRRLTQRERPSGPAANSVIIADGGRRTSDIGTQTSDSDLRPSASHRFGGRDLALLDLRAAVVSVFGRRPRSEVWRPLHDYP